MKTCGKCLNFDFCKEYVTKGESFAEMPKGCPAFKRKPLFKWKHKLKELVGEDNASKN